MEGLEDFLNVLGDDEGGEVEHDADADACADIGGAGGEVAELLVECERDAFLEFVVDVRDFLPAAVEIESAAE